MYVVKRKDRPEESWLIVARRKTEEDVKQALKILQQFTKDSRVKFWYGEEKDSIE